MNWWDIIAIQPVVNVLIVLSHYLFNNPGLAIILLTIIVNLIILPLTLKQIRSSKAMQDVQPKLAELQKKYAKDKQKLAQEQMALYKQAGMNPAGCLLPLLVQMPVWIALLARDDQRSVALVNGQSGKVALGGFARADDHYP